MLVSLHNEQPVEVQVKCWPFLLGPLSLTVFLRIFFAIPLLLFFKFYSEFLSLCASAWTCSSKERNLCLIFVCLQTLKKSLSPHWDVASQKHREVTSKPWLLPGVFSTCPVIELGEDARNSPFFKHWEIKGQKKLYHWLGLREPAGSFDQGKDTSKVEASFTFAMDIASFFVAQLQSFSLNITL